MGALNSAALDPQLLRALMQSARDQAARQGQGRKGGGCVVSVSAYTRVRDGHEEHVGAYQRTNPCCGNDRQVQAEPVMARVSLLAEAEADDISLRLIMAAADKANDLEAGRCRQDRRLQVLGMLLDHGFQAVDFLPEGKCRPWSDQGRMSILRRIAADWPANPDEGWLGSTYWFERPSGPG